MKKCLLFFSNKINFGVDIFLVICDFLHVYIHNIPFANMIICFLTWAEHPEVVKALLCSISMQSYKIS